MAALYIVNTLMAICLALCGGGLGEEAGDQTCTSSKGCICSGTRVTCSNGKLRSMPVGIPLETTILDLSSNEIQSLDLQQLSGLKNLKELYLHDNELRDSPPWQSLPSALTHLSLHHNRITFIPSQNINNMTKQLSIQSLLLSNNKISTIGANAFANLSKLQLLKLNRNKLTSIPMDALRDLSSLRKLDLTKNLIRVIETSFKELKSLVILSLKVMHPFVPSISVYEKKNKETLLSSLQARCFVNNSLFRGYNKNALSLRNIKQTELLCNIQGNGYLNGFVCTAYFLKKLSKNKINRVQIDSFWHLNNLRELYLDNNNLTVASTTWFFSLGSLQKLYLNNNRIRQLKTSSSMNWRQVLLLQELNLAKNELCHIETSTFAHLSALKNLNLGNNHIYHIAEDAFSDLHSLTVLDLSNNDLSSTLEETNGAFTGLKNLLMLRLDGNRITWIAAGAFSGLKEVKSLNLSANIITSIEENAFQEMTKLQLLFLNTTQLLCDCKIMWLRAWLEKNNFKASVHATCLHPKQLERRSIFNLTSSDFVCDNTDPKPRIVTHPEAHTVLVGENVTLRCVIMLKNNTVRVSWKRNNKPLSGVRVVTRAQFKDGDSETYSSELHLTSVKESDDGFYQCIASNQFAPVPSKMAKVTVWMYPVLLEKPKNVTVRVGNTFELHCNAVGHPLPKVAWQKDGGKRFPAADERRMDLLPNKTYRVRNATSLDQGKYTCNASNEAGFVSASAFVTVLERPRLLQSMPSKQEVEKSQSVVLQCLVSGSPRPSIVWFRDKHIVKKSARVVFAESGQLLVIMRVSQQDEGQYICEASNTEGVIRGKGELIVVSGDSPETDSEHVKEKDKTQKSQYVQYHKKTFLGIIVIVVVSCIVVTSMVWLLIIHCARRTSPRRVVQHSGPFGADCSDESNSKAFQQDISYFALKSSSSSSTQNSRDSPRSTGMFLPSLAESAQGSTPSPKSTSDSGNASGSTSGTEEKSSTTENASSEISLKGSHSSMISSCPSDACLPSYQKVTTTAQIHSSDSDSEKQCLSLSSRRDSPPNVDPAGSLCTGELDVPSCGSSHKQTPSPRTPLITGDDNEHLPVHDHVDVCVTVYPLTNSDTSCATDGPHDSPREA